MADESDIPKSHGLTVFFDSRTIPFRLFILLGACFLTFGSYFCYDMVGALSTDLINPFYGVSSAQEALLYSVYSLPNTVLPFFGGMLVDRYLGVKFGGLLFGSLVLVGQIIWALSGFFPSHTGFYIAVFGRFIFGLGGESLSVTQSSYCGKWFPESFLGTAFGITLAFARIGSAINFIITPRIGTASFAGSLWFGVATCLISIVFAIQLAFWDWRAEKIIPPNKTEAEVIRFKDILHFKYSIWMLIAVCVFFYISIFVFIQNAVAFLLKEYGLDNATAGNLVSLPYLVAAVAAPTFGILVDKTGYILIWLTVACSLNGFAMLILLYLTMIPPVIGMLLVGISYSMVAASLWPCIPLIVQKHEIGTAYGLFFAIQNAGLFVAPLVIGKVTSTGYYTSMMLSFSECAFLAAALSLSVLVCDWMEGRKINRTSKEWAEFRANKDATEKLISRSTGSVNPEDDYDGFDTYDQ